MTLATIVPNSVSETLATQHLPTPGGDVGAQIGQPFQSKPLHVLLSLDIYFIDKQGIDTYIYLQKRTLFCRCRKGNITTSASRSQTQTTGSYEGHSNSGNRHERVDRPVENNDLLTGLENSVSAGS
jgi:hypothetical protein